MSRNIKTNIFIKSTLILVLGGAITKILGMVIKIFTTRIVGTEGIGIYMMIMPTFNLFITLSQLGFPIAISKIVSEDKKNNKKLIFSTIIFSLAFNTVLIFLIFLLAPIFSNILLKNTNTYLPIICIGFTLPFIGISSIARGYFFGKQKMFPHVISNVFEQIVRLIIIIIITPKLLNYGINVAVAGLVIYNVISELLSIIILYFFLPKNFKLCKDEIKPDKSLLKDVMAISIPTTSSRLIGSVGYFFEPIILTQTLMFVGYNNSFITREYGIVSGYAMQMLLMPSFFTMAISQALIPVISKEYARNRISYIKKKIKQACLISFGIGFIITLIIFLFPNFFLKLFFNTTEGTTYLRVLAPFFLIFYLEGPLTSALQAMNKAKEAFKVSFSGIIFKSIILFICCLFKIGMYPLIIANIFNIIYVTYNQYKIVKKSLK
ncbi:MAG: hypothetical protein E7166_01470 [Firmicutes bacterium]|nr:hypothetical protein [Bacillota bacterium]